MTKRLSELAKLVNGTLVCKDDPVISGAASISRAGDSDVTFATSTASLQQFMDSNAMAVVTSEPLLREAGFTKPAIVAEDPEAAFVVIAETFKPPICRDARGISERATISPTAELAENVVVYPGAVIMGGVKIASGSVIYSNVTILENCQIGCDTQIFPGVTLYENTFVGDRCTIHAGAVLGAYGFGYKSASGQHQLSAQLGNVLLGDDVEIGANTTIDRGTYDSTTIGDGTKIDNLVMIGHNCQIGRNNLLCSQVGIAGSCTTGDNTVMGGQVGLGDHLDVGSNVSIGAKSGLMQDVPNGKHMFGIPARPARETMQILAHQSKLPAMRKEFRALTTQVEELQESVRGLTVDRIGSLSKKSAA